MSTLAKPSQTRATEGLPTTVEPTRLSFLDNLRSVVIWCVIVLHASISYMAYPPPWWYVLDPHNNIAFTQLVLLIDVPIMPIMFFIAGYVALPALQKRGTRQFLKDKTIRIGLPWVLGTLFLAPPTAYIILWSRGVPKSLWEFWSTDFWTPALFQQSVYWFLGILMLLFVVLAWVYELSPALRNAVPHPKPGSWRAVAIFMVLTTSAFLLVNRSFPIDAWSHHYVFSYQPVRAPLYVGYFSLGVYAHLRGWFREGGFNPQGGLWFTSAVLAGISYLTCRMQPDTGAVWFLITGISFNIFCLSALFASMQLFQRSINSSGGFWRSQAANSYGIYYIHPLILYPLAYLLVAVALPIGIKALILISTTLLASWGISALVVRTLLLRSQLTRYDQTA